jgi:hypothetical protein
MIVVELDFLRAMKYNVRMIVYTLDFLHNGFYVMYDGLDLRLLAQMDFMS